MSIWLQTSASIQKRTSPLKFDHFRLEIPNFTASNLSTKVRPAPGAEGQPRQERGGALAARGLELGEQVPEADPVPAQPAARRGDGQDAAGERAREEVQAPRAPAARDRRTRGDGREERPGHDDRWNCCF